MESTLYGKDCPNYKTTELHCKIDCSEQQVEIVSILFLFYININNINIE